MNFNTTTQLCLRFDLILTKIMKHLLLALSLLFTLHSSAQKSDISISFGTNINYRYLYNTDKNDQLSENIILNKEDDAEGIEHNVSIHYRKWLNAKNALSMGIEYSNLAYESTNAYFQFPNQHNGNGGLLPYEDDFVRINIHAVNMPILYTNRLLASHKWHFLLIAGIVPTYITFQERIYQYSFPVQEEITEVDFSFGGEFPAIQVAARIGMTIEYRILPKWAFYITPDFSYFLRPSEAESTKEYLYNGALRVGFVWEL